MKGIKAEGKTMNMWRRKNKCKRNVKKGGILLIFIIQRLLHSI